MEPPPDSLVLAARGEGDTRADAERATGPQRTLEPGWAAMLGLPSPRLGAAFEALPTPMLVASCDSDEITPNAAARVALHLGEGDRIRSLDDLSSLVRPRADGAALAKEATPLARALRGETLRGFMLEVRVGDDDERTWKLDAAPMLEGGQQVGAVCTFRDVTDQQLDDAMADDLLGRAAHDLRTPLTAMKASAQLLGRGFDRLDEAARSRTLALLLAQVEKLATRIDEVIDAARIRRGRYDLTPEDLDLTVELTAVTKHITAIPGAPPVKLEAPEGLRARADRARLAQVLTRLVLEAGERHGRTTEIVIRAEAADGGVKLTVEVPQDAPDTGPRRHTARRLALAVFNRLGGSAEQDGRGLRTTVLTLPPPAE